MQQPFNQPSNRYQIKEKLGQGTFGSVYKASDKQTDQYVAIKKIPLDSESEGYPASALREISLVQELNHPNIIKLLNLIYSEVKLELVFEYCETDLRRYLDTFYQNQIVIDVQLKKLLIYQMLKGVQACHNQQIIHRDLKPQNILINSVGIVKIADLGLARQFGIPLKYLNHDVITLPYRPPDILLGSNLYNTNSDVWSIGCIIVEIFNLRPLFTGKDELGQLNRIFFITGTPNEQKWPGVKNLPLWKATQQFDKYEGNPIQKFCPSMDEQALDLVQKMLQCNPQDRISIKTALEHPYFKGMEETYQQLPLYQKNIVQNQMTQQINQNQQ